MGKWNVEVVERMDVCEDETLVEVIHVEQGWEGRNIEKILGEIY